MSSWRARFGPGLKSTINAQLAAATVANSAVSMDGAAALPINAAHFAAAIASAQAALASLAGTATKARVIMTGYADTNTAAPHPGATASSIRVECVEIF
jgi:hypothetical protein